MVCFLGSSMTGKNNPHCLNPQDQEVNQHVQRGPVLVFEGWNDQCIGCTVARTAGQGAPHVASCHPVKSNKKRKKLAKMTGKICY